MRQDLLEKWLVGIGRDRADQGFRPGEGVGRIGRDRRQPRRASPSSAVEVDRERLLNGLDAMRELRMLPEQDIEPCQRQIRRHTERGIPAAKDRYSLSGQ